MNDLGQDFETGPHASTACSPASSSVLHRLNSTGVFGCMEVVWGIQTCEAYNTGHMEEDVTKRNIPKVIDGQMSGSYYSCYY